MSKEKATIEDLRDEIGELKAFQDYVLLPLVTVLTDVALYGSSSAVQPGINPLKKYISYRLRNEELGQKSKDFLTKILEQNFPAYKTYNRNK